MTEIDNYHWHELLHGTSLIIDLTQSVFCRNSANDIINSNPELLALSSAAVDNLSKLYQAIGKTAPHLQCKEDKHNWLCGDCD